MGRDMKDIGGRALQRRTKDAMGRALFKKPTGRTLADAIQKKGHPHKQGYKAREDESLGMRTGKEAGKKQSMKARRDESYGAWGKRGNKKINKAKGGTVKKQHGGMTQGYNARLDESLGARKGPYSGAATMAKHGGTIKKKKKK